LNTGSPTK